MIKKRVELIDFPGLNDHECQIFMKTLMPTLIKSCSSFIYVTKPDVIGSDDDVNCINNIKKEIYDNKKKNISKLDLDHFIVIVNKIDIIGSQDKLGINGCLQKAKTHLENAFGIKLAYDAIPYSAKEELEKRNESFLDFIMTQFDYFKQIKVGGSFDSYLEFSMQQAADKKIADEFPNEYLKEFNSMKNELIKRKISVDEKILKKLYVLRKRNKPKEAESIVAKTIKDIAVLKFKKLNLEVQKDLEAKRKSTILFLENVLLQENRTIEDSDKMLSTAESLRIKIEKTISMERGSMLNLVDVYQKEMEIKINDIVDSGLQKLEIGAIQKKLEDFKIFSETQLQTFQSKNEIVVSKFQDNIKNLNAEINEFMITNEFDKQFKGMNEIDNQKITLVILNMTKK